MSQYAVYATCQVRSSRRKIVHSRTFRIGQPTTLGNAHARHQRLDNLHYRNRRPLGVFVAGRGKPYLVAFLEVRQVDEQGRGLGAERHHHATPVLCGAIRVLPDAPHTLVTYRNRSWRATHVWGATLTANRGGVVIGYGRTPIAAAANARREARGAQVI